MVYLKWFASIDSVRTHCRRFHGGQGVPITGKHRELQEDAPEELPPTAFICPTCGFQRHSKHGLTRHRIVNHGFRPDTVKPSQRGQCEETSMHLLSCPALKSLRCHFAVGGSNMEKLCFMKKFAQQVLALERLCSQRSSTTDVTP
ncbi:hypothetical protein DQ04_19761000, partial [Trypanosoma grayi]|uniref:hypothetical protein n=1 Tax=Trypanosoma grayi TaxID=71804 RepID=UPI0004F3F1D8